MARFVRSVLLLALLAFLVPAAPPVAASPTNVRLVEIYRADDCARACPDGTARVAPGATAAGPLQIHVHAEDPLGLRWVRVEARFGDRPEWICVQHWEVRSQLSMDGWYTWYSHMWPAPDQKPSEDATGTQSDCTEASQHYHRPTHNEVTTLRVTAANYVEEQDRATSTTRTLTLANPPVAPVWVAAPTTSTSGAVTLAWEPNPEPDIREYRWVRIDPDGTSNEFAIDALKPERSGCTRIGNAQVRCTDTTVPDSGGSFTYALFAIRTAVGGTTTCAIGGGACIESPPSERQRLTVAARAAAPDSPPATGSAPPLTVIAPGATPSPAGSGDATTPTSEPVTVEGENRTEQLAAAGDEPAAGFPVIPAAAGFLVVSLALFGVRSRRRRPR